MESKICLFVQVNIYIYKCFIFIHVVYTIAIYILYVYIYIYTPLLISMDDVGVDGENPTKKYCLHVLVSNFPPA